MSANDPDFVRLQQLQSREWSYLKAQERQAGRLAKTVTNCPCRAQHERAACERCNAQQGYKAEPQHLTNSTAYKAAAQAQQQEQALSHRLAGDNRQALITSLEQRLQHADTSLRTCEQELRYDKGMQLSTWSLSTRLYVRCNLLPQDGEAECGIIGSAEGADRSGAAF